MLAVTAALLTLSCGDPLQVIEVPGAIDRRITVMAIFDPDSARQAIAVYTSDHGAAPLDGLVVEVHVDGARILRYEMDSATVEDQFPCVTRYGSTAPGACATVDLKPTHGREYSVTVSASERPTATGATTIPGAFDVLSATAQGSPPGTDGLTADWIRSNQAHRYIVTMRPRRSDCTSVRGCPGDW